MQVQCTECRERKTYPVPDSMAEVLPLQYVASTRAMVIAMAAAAAVMGFIFIAVANSKRVW